MDHSKIALPTLVMKKKNGFKFGSLLQLLWTLEKEPINESRILFEHESQNAFFKRLMHGGSRCLVTSKVLEKFTNVKPLPKNGQLCDK
jgi:hypothetical protein